MKNLETKLPENIKTLKPYVSGKTIAEVKALYQPAQISKLASNENRLGFSKLVKDSVLKALDGIQDYPDPLALQLRRELARRYSVGEKEILLGAGSESLISIICRTFFKDHENAITADATFVGFFVQAGVRGIEVKKVPVTNEYKFDVLNILNTVDESTKMVYIANPNNPTGTYLNQKEYENLLSGLPDDVLLIVDEAYFEYAQPVTDYPNALANRRENVIVLRTFSKAYGLAGFRIGYAIADENLIREMTKTKLTFEPATPAQAAALASLQDEEFIKRGVDMVEKGKKRLYDFFDLQGVKYVKSAANSVLMVLESDQQAEVFTQNMLAEGVILRRVNGFGLPHCVRITIGTEREMNHFEESFLKINQPL
ncbi:MAG: histidinol-phosphate transaminase [Balneolaceae bacterium]|nr:histidinol-phosphate transaminase [Balneolaceae bacterium]